MIAIYQHLTPLRGLRILDIGCGGGLLSEPMARLGAEIIGVDAAAGNIPVAAAHAAQSGLNIDYRHTTAETMAADGERFDVVMNMEVVETRRRSTSLPNSLSGAAKARRTAHLLNHQPQSKILCVLRLLAQSTLCAGFLKVPTSGTSSSHLMNYLDC